MATQKRTTTKNKTNQFSAKSPIVIEEEHLIGRVMQPASQSIAVSLIRANSRRYIGIMQQYRRKADNQWVSRGGRWIPFRDAEEVSQLLQQAYAEGKKMHWDAEPTQTELNFENASKKEATEATVDVETELREIKSALKRLESYINETKESAEMKAQREMISRILNALS